jgi:hypothetical protein
MKMKTQYFFVFLGFLALWCTMMYPDDSPAWIWMLTIGLVVVLIILPQVLRIADPMDSRRWIWTVSALIGVSVFVSILQMLEYPLIRGIEAEIPWWESRQWARTGAIIGLPIAWLVWKDWWNNDIRSWIFGGLGFTWSLVLIPVFAGVLTIIRQLFSSAFSTIDHMRTKTRTRLHF